MGRLTDDMTRLVGELHAARDDRRRLLWGLKDATAEVKRAVARLRSSFAADLAGARAAWLGAPAFVARRVGQPGPAAPARRETEAQREGEEAELEEVVRKAAAERRARDEARVVRKARERHRGRSKRHRRATR